MKRYSPLKRPRHWLPSLLGLLCLLHAVLSAAPAPAWQVELKVMSYNVRKGVDANQQRAIFEVQRVVAGQLPDLLAVQEIDEKDAGLLARTSGFAHHATVRAYGPENWRPRLAVFSRWPITITALPLANSKGQRKFAKAVIDMQGIPLVFYAAHFSREGLVDSGGKGLLKEVLGMSSRSDQMASIVDDIKADRHRYRILAGDLNTFPLSAPYRQLSEVMQDAFPDMLGKGSYKVSEIKGGRFQDMPSPKIDHIFHGQGMKALSAQVVEDGPSDHYPVTALLALQVSGHGLGPGEIKSAQETLRGLGLGSLQPSGEMDPATRRAIARFQKTHNLTIDGNLNPETWRKLRQMR